MTCFSYLASTLTYYIHIIMSALNQCIFVQSLCLAISVLNSILISLDGKKSTGARTTPGYSPSKKSSSMTGDTHGVTMSDDEAIIGHFESFSARLRQIMDVMNTMAQYEK